MSATHNVLWKRVTAALQSRGVEPSGGPREVAAEAHTKLGTDLVEQFLNDYYFDKQYGDGHSKISEESAEALVCRIEQLPTPAAPTTKPSGLPVGIVFVSPQPVSPAPWPQPPSTLEEAEAYGNDESRASIFDALRQGLLEWRVKREARRQERARTKAQTQAARQAEALAKEESRKMAAARQAEERDAMRLQAQRKAEEQKRKAEEEKELAAARTRAAAQSLLQRVGEQWGKGDRRGAVSLLEKLVRQQPDSATGWFTLAWYFGREGNFRRSVPCYKRGLKLDPQHKVAWNNLGHDLRGLRRFKASAEALQQAIDLDPAYVTALANLGSTLRQDKKFERAKETLIKVVNLRPSDAVSLYWLGVCCANCGDHQGAADALQRASNIITDNASLWMLLGDSLRKLGRKAEATEAYARAKSLGAPPPVLRTEVPFLALIAFAASVGVGLWGGVFLGPIATGAFGWMVGRLSLTRVKLFLVLVPSLPLLALQFADLPAFGATIAMGFLLIWTACASRIWQYRRG
jgi:tetratricopeptide (TPR) repeat protein